MTIKQAQQGFIVLLIIILCNCKRNEQERFYINPQSIPKTDVFLSEYSENIQYIPLSFEVPISKIIAIDFDENFIFIGSGLTGMLVFNKDGSFNKKIGNTGRGPGEYRSINSFSIDPENRLIYMLDAGPEAKVIVYDFNGNFKYEFSNIDLHGTFQKIVFDNDKLYLFEIFVAGNAKYNWAEIDLHGNVLSTRKNSIPSNNTMVTIFINPIYKYQNGIGYWNQYNDTIFRIENGKSSARLFFAKGEFRLPMDETLELDKYFKVMNILETDLNIWVMELNSPTFNVIILDKQDELSRSANEIVNAKMAINGLTNDIDGGLNFVPERYLIINEDKYLLGWNEAFQLKNHVESANFKTSTPKYPEKKKQLEQLANRLDENDNPVLILVKLKE